ncbi:MAG TPA: ABC transporter permease [Conexibacter sp.]|nr:ABC transporter permease [Conexibacter sp.]
MSGVDAFFPATDPQPRPAGRLDGVGRALRRARPWSSARTSLWVGLALLGLVVLASALVPLLSPYGSNEIVAAPYEAPSWSHPFGTDSVGRDLFVRVFVAGRLDLAVAAIIVVAALAVGSVLGTLAGGARRRWVDTALMRLVDAVIAFPFLVLVLVLVVVFGTERSLGPLPAGAPAVILGVILGDWAFYARLARGQTLALRERDYVVAARVLGFSQPRIVLRHLLPGVVGTIAAYAVADAILVMITVASLSFVGVGVQPPTPEWGALMYDGRAVLQDAWWITVIPGVMLALTGLGLSLVADTLLSGRAER